MVGPKMGVFMTKTTKMTGCHFRGKNQPGNRIMGQNTPQAMGIDVLGTFMPYSGGSPGPGWSKNGYIQV